MDWTGNWGMAASAEDKDYVHLVLRYISEATGKQPDAMIVNIAAFEREFATYDLLKKEKAAFAFKPDVVVLAIGENVPALKTENAKEELKASLLKLLRALQAENKPTILVRSVFGRTAPRIWCSSRLARKSVASMLTSAILAKIRPTTHGRNEHLKTVAWPIIPATRACKPSLRR